MTDFAPLPDPSNTTPVGGLPHQARGIPGDIGGLRAGRFVHPSQPAISIQYLFHPDPSERATVLRSLLQVPERVGEFASEMRDAISREDDPAVQALLLEVVERGARTFSDVQALIPFFWRQDVSSEVVTRALQLSERYRYLVPIFAPNLLRMVGDDRNDIVALAEGACLRCPTLAAPEMYEIFEFVFAEEIPPRVVGAAVQMLSKGVGRTGELVEILFAFASSGDLLQRQVAYRALGSVVRRQSYPGELLDRVAEGFDDPDSAIVLEALKVFESVRFRGHGKGLEIINCLNHGDESVRLAAVSTICAVGCFVDATPALIHRFETDYSGEVREKCRAVITMQAEGMVSNHPALFVNLLRQADSELYGVIKRALLRHPPEPAFWVEYLQDPSASVRRVAAEAVVDRCSSRHVVGAEALLPSLLLDSDGEVRMWGARLAGRLGTRCAAYAQVLAYCASSAEESKDCRIFLLRALGVVGESGIKALPLLTRMAHALPADDREFSREVVRSLARVDLQGEGCSRLLNEIGTSLTGDIVQLCESLKRLDMVAQIYSESWRSFRTIQPHLLSRREVLEIAVGRVRDSLPGTLAPSFKGIVKSLRLAAHARGTFSFHAFRLFL